MAYKTKRKKKKNEYDPVDEKTLAVFDQAAADPKRSATVIVKLLQDIAKAGYPPGDIFIDFLRLTEVMLDELPRHAISVKKTGQLDYTDPPDIQKFYAGLRERYPPQDKRWVWGNLTAAVAALAFVSPEIPQDVIGQVYARFACPKNREQVLPFKTAVKKAKKALGREPFEHVLDRIGDAADEAAKDNPLAASVINTGLLGGKMAKTTFDDAWVQQFARNNILPAILPYYEPLRVFDPELGPGTLMLASSTLFPDWAVKLGMVRFEGTDPDPLCVQMATLNAKIYGLNGQHLKAHRAMLQIMGEADEDLPAHLLTVPDCFRRTEESDKNEDRSHQITLL